MAFSRRSCSARASPRARSLAGILTFDSGVTCSGRVRHAAGLEPLLEAGAELLGREILAPERRVLLAGLGQRAVEVEHADEARPLPGPVGAGEDRPLVRQQAGQHVVRVLPDRLGDDQRGLRVDSGEDLHALGLRADEAVLLIPLVRMGPHDLVAEVGDGLGTGPVPSRAGPASTPGWPTGEGRRWRPSGLASCRLLPLSRAWEACRLP